MILFSHGFGVQKDARGLFTAIAEQLTDEYVLFDYNSWDNQKRMLKVVPLDDQVQRFKNELGKMSGPIDLVCHSQGCLVAALAQPANIRSAIFLGPATTTTSDEFAKLFTDRPESTYDPAGESILQRSDGSQTIVPAEYWASLDAVGDVLIPYLRFTKQTNLHIVTAGEDEIVQTDVFGELPIAGLSSIPGANHNFTDASRQLVVQKTLSILDQS